MNIKQRRLSQFPAVCKAEMLNQQPTVVMCWLKESKEKCNKNSCHIRCSPAGCSVLPSFRDVSNSCEALPRCQLGLSAHQFSPCCKCHTAWLQSNASAHGTESCLICASLPKQIPANDLDADQQMLPCKVAAFILWSLWLNFF